MSRNFTVQYKPQHNTTYPHAHTTHPQPLWLNGENIVSMFVRTWQWPVCAISSFEAFVAGLQPGIQYRQLPPRFNFIHWEAGIGIVGVSSNIFMFIFRLVLVVFHGATTTNRSTITIHTDAWKYHSLGQALAL